MQSDREKLAQLKKRLWGKHPHTFTERDLNEKQTKQSRPDELESLTEEIVKKEYLCIRERTKYTTVI